MAAGEGRVFIRPVDDLSCANLRAHSSRGCSPGFGQLSAVLANCGSGSSKASMVPLTRTFLLNPNSIKDKAVHPVRLNLVWQAQGALMPFIEIHHAGRMHRIDTGYNPIFTGDSGKVLQVRGAVGGGGNGVVFSARGRNEFNQFNLPCAVKMLRKFDGARVDRFQNEIRVMRDLDHPAISKVFDKGEYKSEFAPVGIPWMVMELGGDNLRRHVETKGPIGLSDLVPVSIAILDALAHMHDRGFVHRDIKPDNFVWNIVAPKVPIVKMIDFGISKKIDEDVSARPLDNFTQTMEFVGPVFFSSPELIQYASSKSTLVDHRSDLFQFGKTLWYLLTGRVAAGIPERKLDQTPDKRVHQLVCDLIQDCPDERIQSAELIKNIILAWPPLA